jgi:hypothetical protein
VVVPREIDSKLYVLYSGRIYNVSWKRRDVALEQSISGIATTWYWTRVSELPLTERNQGVFFAIPDCEQLFCGDWE